MVSKRARESMLDQINFADALPTLGDHAPPRISIHNVQVSVRPEIILKAKGKKGAPLIGGVKLHFPRTFSLDDDAGAFVSTMIQEFGKAHLSGQGETFGPMCYVIDVGSKKVCPGVKATTNRMKEIIANCQNIVALWPTITPDD